MRRTVVALAAAGLGLAAAVSAIAQAPSTPQEQIAALRASIQANKQALRERVSFQPLPGPGKQVEVTVADCLVPGDSFAITVAFDTFSDGVTFYPKDVVLDAEAEHLQVEVQNGGYRRMTP